MREQLKGYPGKFRRIGTTGGRLLSRDRCNHTPASRGEHLDSGQPTSLITMPCTASMSRFFKRYEVVIVGRLLTSSTTIASPRL